MAGPIRLLIVDDHPVVRQGLRAGLGQEVDIRIIGEAIDGNEAISMATELKPDVVLMELLLPRVNGLEALTTIKGKLPKTKVVILTVMQHESDMFQALRLGAQSFLLKSSSMKEIADAVRRSAAGETVIQPSLACKVVDEFRKQDNKTALSIRETEVLHAVGEGLSNTEIAQRMFLSESTVRTYLRRLFEKLNLKNRFEAAVYVREHMLPPARQS